MSSKEELILIPKYEKYMQYIIEAITKMRRTEKFNIGNEYKTIMYKTLENILYINKIEISKRLYYLNLIDAELSTQRVMLRLMLKNRWMDGNKFKVAMSEIYEIGKILGGLIKQYAKNNKKWVLQKANIWKFNASSSKKQKRKSLRKEIILFNMKQEEYIMWLYEKLKNKTYKHSGYSEFYVTEPKLRTIEKSK